MFLKTFKTTNIVFKFFKFISYKFIIMIDFSLIYKSINIMMYGYCQSVISKGFRVFRYVSHASTVRHCGDF